MKIIKKTRETAKDEISVIGISLGDTEFGFSIIKPRKHKWKIANVDSSMIRRVKFDDDARIMRVLFHNWDEYEYETITYKIFQDLIHAESVGKHFHKHVKDKFPCTKLEKE